MPNNNKDTFKSNYFSIEEWEREAPQAGFILEKVDTTLIKDGFDNKDRDTINKICTSIPTPFARLFLFRTAFMEIHKAEAKAIPRNPGSKNGGVHKANGLYNYMVSDCLDMLEFLFYYGSQPGFNVIEWNCNAELGNLLSTECKGHERLNKALKNHLATDKVLKNVNTIYIFTWTDQPDNPNILPVVIGGTSPFSLVYTSPNWIREKKARGWNFRAGKNGNNLFDNDPSHLDPPRALCQRSERFKTYMYKMWFAFGKKSPSLNEFWTYIEQSWIYYDKETDFGREFSGMENNYNPSHFKGTAKEEDKGSYPDTLHCIIKDGRGRFTDSTKDALVYGDGDAAYAIPLRCQSMTGLTVHEDYQIRCSRLPKEKTGSNEAVVIQPPLVLDAECELAGAKYFEDEPWASYKGTMPSYNAVDEKYWERKLPGTNKPYPYLCKEDFLEDRIIGLPSNMSNEHFLTGNSGEVLFLPPLKKNFFKFFGVEDLFVMDADGSVTTESNGLPKVKKDIYSFENNGDSVTITLRIPVKFNDQDIVMRKTYYDEDIVYCDDADAGRSFNLSIFPFYQIIGEEAKYNKYNVMLGYKGNIGLKFYKFDDINSEIPVTAKDRTHTNSIDTRYYTIDETFDIIEVEANGAHGIVMPLFRRVKLGTQTMVFCVDFGTTNTHIAYAIDRGNTVENPLDFSYDEKDSQVVSLYDIGGYLKYKPTMKREFVPEEIFTSGGPANDKLSFPIRTTACVSDKWMNDKNATTYNLFGDSNVGFYYLNEDQPGKTGNTYKQNIKWAKTDKVKKLRNAFFDEIMWMLKNKAVLNDCSMDFKFYFTYPQAMEGKEIDILYKLWKNARLNVNAGNPANNMQENDRNHPVESIVPWYYHRKDAGVGNDEVYMNVDIGGGTMDIVYYDPNHDENYTYSARFAANDLWGDGLDEQSADRKNNAFIRGYKAHNLADLPTSLNDRYDAFYGNADDSSDIISFLFKYDKDYGFSDYVKNSPLMTLLLMHVGAVAYYIGLVLKKDGLEVPQKLGFTGMGSLYLNIISPKSSDIAEIVKSVFRYQGLPEEEINRLEVILIDNPKVVTARGGVVFHHPKENMYQSESTVWGYDGELGTDKVRKCDVLGKKNDVLTLINDFVDYFESSEFNDMRAKLNRGWDYQQIDKTMFMDMAGKSFMAWYNEIKETTTEKQKDPLFFWPLKDLLFKYGLKI